MWISFIIRSLIYKKVVNKIGHYLFYCTSPGYLQWKFFMFINLYIQVGIFIFDYGDL